MRQKGSWSLISDWITRDSLPAAERLLSGVIVVHDHTLAQAVLNPPDPVFHDQSGFFRTQNFRPIPPELRDICLGQLRVLLKTHEQPSVGDIRSYLSATDTTEVQSWGVLAVQWYFRSLILKDRGTEAEDVVAEFIRAVVIRDSIRGKIPRRRAKRIFASSCTNMARILASASRNESGPQDLVDVVLSIRGRVQADDLGELFLRLVLSVVGFTGIALEWALNPPVPWVPQNQKHVMPYLLELQRCFPTAWRLLRDADVAHILGDLVVAPGDHVVVSTTSVHRGDGWDEGQIFSPLRWTHSEARESPFLAFGMGPGACPARGVALLTIARFVEVGMDLGKIQPRINHPKRPYALTLLALGK